MEKGENMGKDEIIKVNWGEKDDNYFRKLGEIVFHGDTIYNYDDDCWRYAPDVYFEFVVNGDDAEVISEEEAKKIVEGKGGKNFDNLEDVLYKVDEDGLYSGID